MSLALELKGDNFNAVELKMGLTFNPDTLTGTDKKNFAKSEELFGEELKAAVAKFDKAITDGISPAALPPFRTGLSDLDDILNGILRKRLPKDLSETELEEATSKEVTGNGAFDNTSCGACKILKKVLSNQVVTRSEVMDIPPYVLADHINGAREKGAITEQEATKLITTLVTLPN